MLSRFDHGHRLSKQGKSQAQRAEVQGRAAATGSDVLGSYLIGGVLLGITLWIYLKLKERGILNEVSGVCY